MSPSSILLARTDLASGRVALNDRLDAPEEIHDAGDFQPVEYLVGSFVVVDESRVLKNR